MKTLRRSRRGAATVELAVLMIVLIPTIMYTMFLEDLLFYKFDLAETVMSTPWDFTNHDYRKNDGSAIAGAVRQASMQTFWDHTSAWNSYKDPNYDAKETVHHQAYGAHQCWLAQGGQEIECSFTDTVGISIQPTFNWKNHGGLATCNAILGVQNYFIVNEFFMAFGQGRITSDGRVAGGGNPSMKHHTEGQGAIHDTAKNDPYLYPKLQFGVVHDSWALYKMDDISPNMGFSASEFATWVAIPYGLRSGSLSDANKFADDAISKDILSNLVKVDAVTGDTLLTPPLAYKNENTRTFNSHTASAWSDSRQQNTYNGRQPKYMGMQDSSW